MHVGGTLCPRKKSFKNLKVDTTYSDADIIEGNSLNHIKCSIASILLAVTVRKDNFYIPNFKNYRGIFCHHSFTMNSFLNVGYQQWVSWLNTNNMLQTQFLDGYGKVNLSGKIVTIYNDLSFDILNYNTKQIVRIPEKFVFKHVKSPRDVTSCPIYNTQYNVGSEINFRLDILAIWDLLYYSIYYLNLYVYRVPIPCSPVLPNINTIVDIETSNYNVTMALDIICNKWIYSSKLGYLSYWSEKLFDEYLFECRNFKTLKFNDTVNTVIKHDFAYKFVNRVFCFIGGHYEFLVPDNYIGKALYYDENPNEALDFMLECHNFSKHLNLWFLLHCYNVCKRYMRSNKRIQHNFSYIKATYITFSKHRVQLDPSRHFYLLRGDIYGADKPF